MVLERSSPSGDGHLSGLGEIKEVILLSLNTDRGLGRGKNEEVRGMERERRKEKEIIKKHHTPFSFQSGISSVRPLGCITAPDKI